MPVGGDRVLEDAEGGTLCLGGEAHDVEIDHRELHVRGFAATMVNVPSPLSFHTLPPRRAAGVHPEGPVEIEADEGLRARRGHAEGGPKRCESSSRKR